MSSRRRLRISVAIAASLGVHFAAAMVVTPPPPVEIEGGDTAEIAALGSSFEDLLQGSDRLAPAQADPAITADPVEAPQAKIAPPAPTASAAPVRPAALAHAARPVVAPVANPMMASQSAPVISTGTVPVMVRPDTTGTPKPDAARQTLPSALLPQQIEKAESQAQVEVTEPARKTGLAKPVETAALTPSHATDSVQARPETSPIPVPVARPPRPDDARNLAEARKTQPVATNRKPPAEAPRGNADRNARAGSAEGQAKSKAKRGGASEGGKAARAGNAQASNYPGKVFSKIRRTRQKRAGGTGVVRVHFSIAASGALASVGVSASSGSASVDSAAVDHIRRSAPFPPPPSGAQRKFVIPVEIRR